MTQRTSEVEMAYNCNYSQFDIVQHAKAYINYLQVIITPEGEIRYAVPGMGAAMRKYYAETHSSQETEEAQNRVDSGMTTWIDETGCIEVWNDRVYGKYNQAQKQSLVKLKNAKYEHTHTRLYKGEIL